MYVNIILRILVTKLWKNTWQNIKVQSSQSPTNALDVSCSPYKTYNYVKYIKI
jgi:hypothetical protein